jgi:NAD(P)-dependent dehydrogenase (short-subunit alcohol dehydrogenase family)
MARIFITGSADGLGFLAARLLVSWGHKVVLHARNAERAGQTMDKVPEAEKVLTADLSSMEETKNLATQVNAMGSFDAIIHNAGVYHLSNQLILCVNTLAPYILTCLIHNPKRLIYLSSGMHLHGDPSLKNLTGGTGSAHDYPTYSDSKLHNLILAMAVARKWPDVYANAVNPGWVPTKMGGSAAPDNLEKGFQTQAWLAVSNDDEVKVSGCYFYHKRKMDYLPAAADINVQEKFLSLCEKLSGVRFPADQGKPVSKV